jgi:hypothetical protein
MPKPASTLESLVRNAVADCTITDIHTHLFPPSHGGLLLWGIDELLTYHYLIAELFTFAPADLTYDAFWKMPKRKQADLVWKHVFLEHGPLSEATRGVLTSLARLGLDVGERNLNAIRDWFAQQNVEDYIQKVLNLAGLDYAVMTNDPFQKEEADAWLQGRPTIDRFKAALRIDTLILNWPAAAAAMSAAGYDVYQRPDSKGFDEARRFLRDWARRINPVYMAASLPPSFSYPCECLSSQVIDKVVAPTARELGLPMAMMIGVRKLVNPELRTGGDAAGMSNVPSVGELCLRHPEVKFLVTMLCRDNQHELHVLARKFRNLHMFGCWWYCNNPSIIRELTLLRLELLGTAHTCQHSDARVLDQLLYKWSHSRQIVADALVEKYALQAATGWKATPEEITRDVRAIFGGSFEAFCHR